jgi:hypothetical protein
MFLDLTLGTAIIASFIGAVVSQLLGGDSLNLNLREYQTSFSAREIPFYILLGVFSRIAGSFVQQRDYCWFAIQSENAQISFALASCFSWLNLRLSNSSFARKFP